EWSFAYGLVMFAMWAVMMVAMMLPSAAPVTLLVASIARKRAAAGGAFGTGTALFVLGYLTVWCGFAAVATALQWGLDEAGLMSDTMGLANQVGEAHRIRHEDRKSTRLNSSHVAISYAVFCLKKKMENDSGGRRG